MSAILAGAGVYAAIFGLMGLRNETSYRHRTSYFHDFTFDLVRQRSGEIRIYITGSPGYGGRAADGHSTHRYHDPSRGYFVCVRQDLAPTNFEDAKSWACYWAENTSAYILYNKEFS